MEEPIDSARVAVSWFEAWNEARAHELLELHEKELEVADADVDRASGAEGPVGGPTVYGFAPALWTGGDHRIALFTVEVDPGQGLLCNLRLFPPPDTPPPESVARINRDLDHRERIARLVSPAGRSRAPVGLHRISVSVPEESWRCHLLPRDLTAVEEDLSSDLGPARCEQVGFRFDAGASGLEEVVLIYFHDAQRFELRVMARGAVELGEKRWLPFCDTVARLPLSRYFERITR